MSQTSEPTSAIEKTVSRPSLFRRLLKACFVTMGLTFIHLLVTSVFCLVTGRVSQDYFEIYDERELLLPAFIQLLYLFSNKMYYGWILLVLAVLLIDAPLMFGLQFLSEKRRWISRLWFTSFIVFMFMASGFILSMLSDALDRFSPNIPAETFFSDIEISDDLSNAPYEELPDGEPVFHQVLAGQADETGWCVAKSTRGSFSIELPAPFSDLMLKSTTTTGGIGILHTVACKIRDQPEYNVLETEIIGERPAQLHSMADYLAQELELKGATVTRSEFTLGMIPGDRLSVRAKGSSAEMVLLSTATSDYQIGVQWFSPTAEPTEEEIERFFSSFKISKMQE